MNERIKELAGQAGFDVKRLLAPHPGGFPRDDFLALESFAELIVKECADISDASFHDGSAGYTAILKHFGVEE